MKLLNLILSLMIIIASVILGQQIISNSISNQKNKIDYAELNHVKYGLFSVEEWKRQITVILSDEINELYLSRTNERKLRQHIEVLLNTLIDKVYNKIREENAGSWNQPGAPVARSRMGYFLSLRTWALGSFLSM